MKSKFLQAVIAVFVVMTLMPVVGRAQAEIDPDHFEPNAPGFHGTFNLPFDARCAGVNLPPGSYSVSVQRLGTSDVITLASEGSPVRVQVLGTARTLRSGNEIPSAVVVERTEQQRTVRAIRLGEPGITLDLPAENKAGASGDSELVPISPSTSVPPRN